MLKYSIYLSNYLNNIEDLNFNNVGILVNRSIDMIISILGTLFSVRTFVPLDPK